ncbi:hypothetical protein VPNG_04945 [Cytospora leucostoma]|uniref:Uncharacterized protein n=1 Tax=Cytospora leucostoma TaxID=1230097 RepID=A0A423X753_9PEZI|nr:hypothetical protein VPNG_04945 [Cytospora leucostoma]
MTSDWWLDSALLCACKLHVQSKRPTVQQCGGIDGSRTELDFLHYQIQSYNSTVMERRYGPALELDTSFHEMIKAGILTAFVQ